jgi:hypothetical protein
MNINNKLVLSTIILSLSFIVIGTIGVQTANANLAVLLSPGELLFLFSGVYLLLKNGTFIKSAQYRLARLGIAVLLIGVMFKIMHWPFSAAMLIVGCMSFSALYLYYLIKNNHTRWSHYLALFFILTFSIGTLLKLFRWPYSEEVVFSGMIALLILIIDLVKTKKPY